MGGKLITQKVKEQIISLRKLGLSYNEIGKKHIVSKSTLSHLLRDVALGKNALNLLVAKKYKSKTMSKEEWASAENWAKSKIDKIGEREKLLILAMLYWGEGTKRELNIINGDPSMLRVFLSCLRSMGIKESDLAVSLRIFDRECKEEMIDFWAEVLNVDRNTIIRFEFVEGKKSGKLPYGMCRIRLRKGSLYFKRIMSMIRQVKSLLTPL